MKNSSARWIWLVLAAQIAGLLGWAGYHETVRQTAPTIRLKTVPVDPRDLIRGDYMILSYEISRPGKNEGQGDEQGDEVFVVLRPNGDHHEVAEVLTAEPSVDDKRLWVRGVVWVEGENLRIDYGIERFFVPEGRGSPRFTTLEVEASVSGDHHLYIRRVWLDGKRFP